jgi:hypothetical protein
MKYTKTTPCDNCPFRSDKPFHLGKGRVREIQRSLSRATFACHKTTEAGGCDGGRNAEIHCAGALILLEKLDEPSQMMRIAERLGMYDRTKLKMDAPVYDSFEEMVEGCK